MKALNLNIYTKITYGWLVHALVYDFKAKKWGHLRNIFAGTRGCKHFREFLRENKNIFKNYLGMMICGL